MGTAFAGGVGIVALLLCGGAFYRLFALWLVDRVITTLEFIVLTGVFLSLIALSFVAGLGFLLLLAAGTLIVSFMPMWAQRIGRKQLELQDIAKYHEALKRQPDVPYPHRKLGEIYEARHDWDRAVEHYQAYLELHSPASDIQRRLEYSLEQRRRRDLGLRRCPVCGTDAAPDAVRCAECGFYLQGPREIVDVLTTPEMMRLWRWLIVVFVVPGLILGLIGEWVPAWIGLLLLACGMVATVVFVYGRMIQPGRS